MVRTLLVQVTVTIFGLYCYNNTGYKYYKADFDKMIDMLDEIDWDVNLIKDLNVLETWEKNHDIKPLYQKLCS